MMLWAAGCGQPAPPSLSLADLESGDPAVRVQAIKWAGENGLQEAAPLLVDRLDEQDASIRFFAILALERLTGQTLGYEYAGSASSRRQAVGRWREWLKQRGPQGQE